MSRPSEIYRSSLALLTDLYQLTMAYGYYKCGLADRQAVFNLYFRELPFGGGYAIACGLADAVDYLEHFAVDSEDRAYLQQLTGADGKPLFTPSFLDQLTGLRLSCDVDAVPEGTAVFAGEPLVRVRGPLLQCQLLETALLNIVNFQTLVATKAARVCSAAGDQPVLEFGLRRAQGIDGGLAASRAAYVGGCAATSNLLAGRLHGIPVRGTHAHSWVMCFDDEPAAFAAYAQAMPNNCVFLVDTYDSLGGVHNAIEVGRWLRSRGQQMIGIRLDSGDLARLSRQARILLDQAGFERTAIVASGDLDEWAIHALRARGARVAVWGVGTRLVTAFDQPALGGVYKLGAICDANGNWNYRIKCSEDPAKIPVPGTLQTRRFSRGGQYRGDVVWDEQIGITAATQMVDIRRTGQREDRPIEIEGDAKDLLVPVVRAGIRRMPQISLAELRVRRASELNALPDAIKRLKDPERYPVGLEPRLFRLQRELLNSARTLGDRGQPPGG